MASDQPRAFTIFDLFLELIRVTLISTGCYVGWKLDQHFLALLAGGFVGWLVVFTALVWISIMANKT